MKTCSMKSYLELIPISAKVRRKQNRLTLICIVLAVFLVTAIFSMTDIWSEAEAESSIKRHGNYHIILSGISKEEAARIAGQSDVAVAAWYRVFGEDTDKGWYTAGDKRIVLYGTEPSYVYDIRNYGTEGTFPQNSSEIMLSMDAKEQFGVHEGDGITIDTPAGSFDYTVSGFCGDDSVYNSDIDGICGYMDLSALTGICAVNGQETSPVYYVQFAKGVKLKKAIDGLKKQYGLKNENVKENTIVLGLAGASTKQQLASLYPMAAVVSFMVLTAGALMISSCMNSNVSQRIKFFGMMRCIGASRKQIMHFVRLEALNWCKNAIPIGCGLGTLFTWMACVLLKKLAGGEFAEMSFRLSTPGILFGVLTGVITVLLAAHSPARRAAGISPVAAVSGNGDTGRRFSHGADIRLFKVEKALGVHHAAGAKKNLILMSFSFALTVILFMVFTAGLDFAKKLLPSESDFNPDVSIAGVDDAHSVDKEMKDEISRLPGVEAVFGNGISYNMPAYINGAEGAVDLISYDEYMFRWSEKSIVSGDLSKVIDNADCAMTIFNSNSRLDVGDKIKIGDTELEIACVVSEGIGNNNCPSVVCTEETYRRLTGEENYRLLNIQFTKEITEETIAKIKAAAGENEFADRREENQTSYSSFWVFRIAAYGFLTIISFITVFNIMNSISMSVSARMKQYGVMRAVGMSVGQVTGMVAAEAVTYGVCGLVIGCAAGLYLHRLLTIKLITDHFGGRWRVPVGPLAVIGLIVALSCAAAVWTPAKRIREMSITDTINEFV